MVIDTAGIGNYLSNYHTITATTDVVTSCVILFCFLHHNPNSYVASISDKQSRNTHLVQSNLNILEPLNHKVYIVLLYMFTISPRGYHPPSSQCFDTDMAY